MRKSHKDPNVLCKSPIRTSKYWEALVRLLQSLQPLVIVLLTFPMNNFWARLKFYHIYLCFAFENFRGLRSHCHSERNVSFGWNWIFREENHVRRHLSKNCFLRWMCNMYVFHHSQKLVEIWIMFILPEQILKKLYHFHYLTVFKWINKFGTNIR